MYGPPPEVFCVGGPPVHGNSNGNSAGHANNGHHSLTAARRPPSHLHSLASSGGTLPANGFSYYEGVHSNTHGLPPRRHLPCGRHPPPLPPLPPMATENEYSVIQPVHGYR